PRQPGAWRDGPPSRGRICRVSPRQGERSRKRRDLRQVRRRAFRSRCASPVRPAPRGLRGACRRTRLLEARGRSQHGSAWRIPQDDGARLPHVSPRRRHAAPERGRLQPSRVLGHRRLALRQASLFRRTPDRPVRAEHAAITRLGAQQRAAARTCVEKLAGAGGHRLALAVPALRAGDYRLACGILQRSYEPFTTLIWLSTDLTPATLEAALSARLRSAAFAA